MVILGFFDFLSASVLLAKAWSPDLFSSLAFILAFYFFGKAIYSKFEGSFGGSIVLDLLAGSILLLSIFFYFPGYILIPLALIVAGFAAYHIWLA